MCGSGLRAVAVGYQQIKAGDAKIVVAGGQENMSLSPHAAHMRAGTKMGPVTFTDTMINDGLTDVFNAYHMGVTAENVAEKWQITRAQQDEFATNSQKKASAAQKAGKFKDEIVTVTVKGRRRTVRSLSAFALRLREQALGGDLKAMAMLFAHFQAHSSQDNEAAGLSVLLAEDAAILRDAGLIASEGASPGDSTEDRDGDA